VSISVTFEAIEGQGVEALLEQLRDELIGRTYQPLPARRQEIPKDGGKVRVTEWCRARSSSYSSLSSRRITNRDRLDTRLFAGLDLLSLVVAAVCFRRHDTGGHRRLHADQREFWGKRARSA
jgi:hypothetical protein